MTVTVPDSFRDLLDDCSRADEEVRIRLAAQFYSQGEIGVARAAEIAGLGRREF